MNTMMTSPLGDIALNSNGLRKVIDALSEALRILPAEAREKLIAEYGVTKELELDVEEAKLLKACCLEMIDGYKSGKFGNADMAKPYQVPVDDCTRIEDAGHACTVRCFGGFRDCELFAVTRTETCKQDPATAARIAKKIRNVIDEY